MTEQWGIKPVLIEVGRFQLTSYSFFLSLGFVIGFLIYKKLLKDEGIQRSNAIYIAIFAILGGAIGSKIPLILMNWSALNDMTAWQVIASGRTIVGGLIGGMIGSMAAKKLFHIDVKMGNQLAIPVAVGMAIGRLGCFFNGCCYGIATNGTPLEGFGVDFGDHLLRHPTQLYELFFDLSLAAYLWYYRHQSRVMQQPLAPGILFRIFLNGYMGFRFVLEFIRVEKVGWLGLTDFQWLCLVTIVFINRHVVIKRGGRV